MIWRGPSFQPSRSLVDEEILQAADRQAAKPAITDARSGRSLTFGQLADGIRRLAAGLAEQRRRSRRRRRDRSRQRPRLRRRALRLARGGRHGREREPAAEGSGARAPARDRQAAARLHRLPFAGRRHEAPAPSRCARSRTWTSYSPPRGRVPPRNPDDPALLFPSSGTTGLPKLADAHARGHERVPAGHSTATSAQV